MSIGKLSDKALTLRHVAVTDMLVDHRIAFDAQGMDSLWTHSSKHKARHTDHLDVFNRIHRSTGGNATNQSDFANRVGI